MELRIAKMISRYDALPKKIIYVRLTYKTSLKADKEVGG